MIKLLFATFFFLIACKTNYSQTDWVKWDAEVISYKIGDQTNRFKGNENKTYDSGIISLLRNTYAFFISDLDGDNCPFYPSCSNFFVQSVAETGLIKGSLMFSDRFMRDMNLFKGKSHYPIHKSGKYFDPPINYTLLEEKIKYSFSGKVSD